LIFDIGETSIIDSVFPPKKFLLAVQNIFTECLSWNQYFLWRWYTAKVQYREKSDLSYRVSEVHLPQAKWKCSTSCVDWQSNTTFGHGRHQLEILECDSAKIEFLLEIENIDCWNSTFFNLPAGCMVLILLGERQMKIIIFGKLKLSPLFVYGLPPFQTSWAFPPRTTASAFWKLVKTPCAIATMPLAFSFVFLNPRYSWVKQDLSSAYAPQCDWEERSHNLLLISPT